MPRNDWVGGLRTIIESAVAQEKADKYANTEKRFTELYAGLKWKLAHSCEKMQHMSRKIEGKDYHLSVVPGDNDAGTREVTVLYSYNDEEVTIHDFEIGL